MLSPPPPAKKEIKLINSDSGHNSNGKETGSGYRKASRILVLFYYHDLSIYYPGLFTVKKFIKLYP